VSRRARKPPRMMREMEEKLKKFVTVRKREREKEREREKKKRDLIRFTLPRYAA